MLSSQEEAEWFGAETNPVITSWRESKNPYGMSEADASVEIEERKFAGKLQEFDDEGNQVFFDAEYEDDREALKRALYDAEYEVSIERNMIQNLDGVEIEADSQKELKDKAKEIGYERSDEFVNTKVVGGLDGYSIAHQDLVRDAESFEAEIPRSVKMGFGFGAGLALFQVAVIAGAVTLGMITSKR